MLHVRTLSAGTTDRAAPYTGQRMARQRRDLYLIPADGPSRLFRFRLDVSPRSDR